jgi:AmpD protein
VVTQILNHGWLSGYQIIASPNFNKRPQGTAIDLLVIHNISLPPGEFGTGCVPAFFCNQIEISQLPYFATIAGLQVSAHFFIDRKGDVIQFVSVDERAWHAGASSFCGVENCNDFSVGIELEGCDDIPYTDLQYDALIELTRRLQLYFPAITQQRIVGHDQIAPGRKTDPGSVFDWQRYLMAL